MFYLGVILTGVILLALWWAISTFVLKDEFDPVRVITTVAIVLIGVTVASLITKKAFKKEGLKVVAHK